MFAPVAIQLSKPTARLAWSRSQASWPPNRVLGLILGAEAALCNGAAGVAMPCGSGLDGEMGAVVPGYDVGGPLVMVVGPAVELIPWKSIREASTDPLASIFGDAWVSGWL